MEKECRKEVVQFGAVSGKGKLFPYSRAVKS